MADDKTKRGEPDRSKVAAEETYELGAFASKQGLSAGRRPDADQAGRQSARRARQGRSSLQEGEQALHDVVAWQVRASSLPTTTADSSRATLSSSSARSRTCPTAGDPADGPRRSRGTCATSCAAGGERSARAVGGGGREWDERCRACGGAADRGRGSLRDADSVSAPRDASLGGRGGPAPTRDGTRAPGDRAERAGPSRAAGGARRRSTSRDLSTAPAPRRRSLELAAAPAESLAALERRTRPPARAGA